MSLPSKPRAYVSVVGFAMIEPLLNLIERLEAETQSVGIPNQVQTSPREYGYCTAIVVLAVIVLESAVNRVRDIRNDHERREHPAEYFARVLADSDIADHVAELFVVRDAIVHNHVWEGDIQDDEASGLHFVSGPSKLPQYGDVKYNTRVDPKSRLTNALKLNLVPTRIWRNDVLKVMTTLDRALRQLDTIEYHHIDTHSPIFMFHGEYVSLRGAVERIRQNFL